MSINIRYPNITGLSEKEQLSQVKSYLYQLVEQLNYALPNLGTGDGKGQSTDNNSSGTYEVQGAEVSYYELRSLIIQELQKVENLIDEIEQARDNGEFDGKDGKDGADGKDGQDGKTPVYGVDFTLNEGDVNTIVTEVADKISFTLDNNGNLYYEVEE